MSRTHCGALNKDKKYVGRLLKTNFVNVNLPPNDSELAFQTDSLDLNLSTIGFQVFKEPYWH